MNVHFDPGPCTLAQKTVDYRPWPSTLAQERPLLDGPLRMKTYRFIHMKISLASKNVLFYDHPVQSHENV